MQNSLARMIKRTVRVLTVTTFGLGGTWAYLKYRSLQNIKLHKELLNTDHDEITANCGDLLFMKHECSKSFSVSSIPMCYTQKFYKWYTAITWRTEKYRQSQYDSVAIVIKDSKETRVLIHYFGEFMDLSFEEFVKLPFFKVIGVSKLNCRNENLEQLSYEYRNKIYRVSEIIDNSFPRRSTGLFRDSVDLVLNYWVTIGIANAEELRYFLRQTVGDLEKTHEKIVGRDIASYSGIKILKE